MKILLLLMLISLFVVSSILSQPAISLPEVNFNFGKAPQHIALSHTFWIKSTGTDTLVINKVIPGCGCTKAPLQDSVLAPGDSTKLEIIFSTRSYRGFVAKRPYLETNISEEKVYLRIDAELFPEPESIGPVGFIPYKLDVSQFSERPRRKAKFLLENKSDKDYEITLIDGFNKSFDVKLPKKIKAGESAEGMITVHDDKINTQFEQSFTIQLNDDFRTLLSLPVKRILRVLKK